MLVHIPYKHTQVLSSMGQDRHVYVELIFLRDILDKIVMLSLPEPVRDPSPRRRSRPWLPKKAFISCELCNWPYTIPNS